MQARYVAEKHAIVYRADSRFVPRQWELSLQSNAVSHWLGANLESALAYALYQDILSDLHLALSRCTVLLITLLQTWINFNPSMDK